MKGLLQLGSGSVSYQPVFPIPGHAEQDPGLWLAALGPAIASALREAQIPPSQIGALAVCGQLDGCIPADKSGKALGNALIWMDRRGEPFLSGLDRDEISERTGLVLDATHMAAKIAWHQQHFNDLPSVAMWHQPVSFLVAALTGENVIDPGLASTTMLLNLSTQQWDNALLEALAIDVGKAPIDPRDGECGGGLTAAGAELTAWCLVHSWRLVPATISPARLAAGSAGAVS
jgi:sugar (pentulose or hexulose) kinase